MFLPWSADDELRMTSSESSVSIGNLHVEVAWVVPYQIFHPLLCVFDILGIPVVAHPLAFHRRVENYSVVNNKYIVIAIP